MSRALIQMVREMIEDGRSDDEIAADVASCLYEAECETREAEDFERNAYGPADDMRSPHEASYSDRLDMGRNDAGEWLGFM